MSALSDYAEQKVLDYLLGITTVPAMTTRYLALFTADPTDTGSLANEISGGTYARQAISSAMSATNATTGQSSNASVISFGTATANHGTITHWAIMDALTSGNMLIHESLTTALPYNTGDAMNIAASQLTITIA